MATRSFSRGRGRWFLVGVLLSCGAAAQAASAALPPPAIVTGQDAGWPEVRAWTADGAQAQGGAPWGAFNIQLAAYPTYQQGVRVAVGDVTGDGRPEIVTAPGKDAWTEIHVFDGRSFREVASYPPFRTGWWTGAFVSAGDTNGDGRSEVVVGLDRGCCTRIQVLDGVTGNGLSSISPFGDNNDAGARVVNADLNGDGKAEVLASQLGSGRVQAFASSGGAAFRTLEPFASPADISIAAGDVVGTSTPELVAGAATPSGAQVKVLDVQTGATAVSLLPFGDGSFAPQVAVGDVNGDGHADVVASAQTSGGTQVKAFDAVTGRQLSSFFVLEPGVVPGASLAAGDLDGDGSAEIVLGGGPTSTPWPPTSNGPDQRVVVYRTDGTLVGGFDAYPGVFQGGVRVAFGDLDRDGFRDLVTGPGPGLVPEVETFTQNWSDDRDRGTRLSHFLAYEPGFRGGVSVAAGDVLGRRAAQIVTGPGAGRPADVRVFDSAGVLQASFRAFEDAYTGGISVATGDLNADGTAEIVVGTLSGPARVRAFSAFGVPYGAVVFPFPGIERGLDVAVADLRGDGGGVILAAQASGTHPLLALIEPLVAGVYRTLDPAPSVTTGLRVAAGDFDDDGRDEIVLAPGWGGDGIVRVLNSKLSEKRAFRPLYDGFGFDVAAPARIGLPIRADALTAKVRVHRRTTFAIARFVDVQSMRIGPVIATIDWPGGASTRGKVVRGSAYSLYVRTTRTFGRIGTYRVTVTLTDGAGRVSVARSTVVVRRR